MRFVIFSDLHGSGQGLELLTARTWPADTKKICLGDVSDFDEQSVEYFHRVRELSDQMILGNHEAVLIDTCDIKIFNPKVHEAISLTKAFLQKKHPNFLAELAKLPLRINFGAAEAAHGSFNPKNPWQYVRYIEDVKEEEGFLPTKINFLAHGHIPFIAWRIDGLWYYQRQIYNTVFKLNPAYTYVINCGSILGSREMRHLEKSFLTYDADKSEVQFYNIAQ